MERAVLYARVSGDDSQKDNRNLDGQLDMCREHAHNKGWTVVVAMSEDEKGASGYELDLPKLEKIFSMAEEGEFDILVVREMDRLSRSIVKQLRIEEILTEFGVKIEYVIENYPNTPEGQLLKNIRTVIAEYEREKILERFRRGRRLLVKAGNIMTAGRRLYGYRAKIQGGKRCYTLVRSEADTIKRIFIWYAIGEDGGRPMTMPAIANKLNDSGVPTRSQSMRELSQRYIVGTSWTQQAIGKILRNETYTGVWLWEKTRAGKDGRRVLIDPKKLLRLDVPAIISEELWQAVQERRVRAQLRRGRNRENFLLYRRLVCGDCGLRMGIRQGVRPSGKSYRYYRCDRRDLKDSGCGNYRNYPGEWLDAAVFSWIEEVIRYHNDDREIVSAGEIVGAFSGSEDLIDVDKTTQTQRKSMNYMISLFTFGVLTIEDLDHHYGEQMKKMRSIREINAESRSTAGPSLLSEWDNFISLLHPEQLKETMERCASDLESRKRLIKAINAMGHLSSENGFLVANMKCSLGETRLTMKARIR